MAQPRFLRADKQPARAQETVGAYNTSVAARVATPTSKSQSASRFSSFEVALTDVIEALAVFKGVLAESEGRFPQRAESRSKEAAMVAVRMQAVRVSRMPCSSRVCSSSSRNRRGRWQILVAARAVSINRLVRFCGKAPKLDILIDKLRRLQPFELISWYVWMCIFPHILLANGTLVSICPQKLAFWQRVKADHAI